MWSLPERLVGLAFVILVSFAAGWAGCREYGKGSETKLLIAEKHETAKAIEQSTSASVKIDNDIETDHTRIDAIKSAVSIRLSTPTYPANHESEQHLVPGSAAAAELPLRPDHVFAPVLDAGTVRLLNAARAGELRAAGGSNDQEPATSGPAR